MRTQIYSAAMSLLLAASMAAAETTRCDGRIIEEGMSSAEVLKYCGPPDEKDMVNDNAWIYRKGDSRLDVIIHFYANGNVRMIETVDE